jgi:hypothetical protein
MWSQGLRRKGAAAFPRNKPGLGKQLKPWLLSVKGQNMQMDVNL